jgi:hypothetical protein
MCNKTYRVEAYTMNPGKRHQAEEMAFAQDLKERGESDRDIWKSIYVAAWFHGYTRAMSTARTMIKKELPK